MREFRGKRIDTNEWVYGYYAVTPITDVNSGADADTGWFFLSDGKERHVIISDSVAYTVRPETVSQWIGMHVELSAPVSSCNLTEIEKVYEGDIIQYRYSGFIYGIVKFQNGCFGIEKDGQFTIIDSPHFFLDRVVIGDIYTPEVQTINWLEYKFKE